MLTDQEIKYCAEECHRQQSSELSVSRMCNALIYLKNLKLFDVSSTKDLMAKVQKLGFIIEPNKNPFGFRSQPVTVEGSIIPVIDFERQIIKLFEADLTPIEWYKEFQLIHPFNDGNSRVGSLFYNLLDNKLIALKPPPDLFIQ